MFSIHYQYLLKYSGPKPGKKDASNAHKINLKCVHIFFFKH